MDYHGEMNEDNFLHWFEIQLLMKLEEPSIIVMDNASYHSSLVEKAPNTSTRKNEIQAWLTAKNISFMTNLLKPHCLFNPIENIWGITKTYYNRHVGRDGESAEHALAMWEEAVNTITPGVWANTIRNTEQTIIKWWERELLFDRDEVAPLIINLNDSDSDEWSGFSELDESEI